MHLCIMLLMAMLSTTVWAEVVPFTENYSEKSTTAGWTSSVSGRFTPIIYNEAELAPGGGFENNYFLSVNQKERSNNGCIVTGSILSGKAAAGDDFVLEFDMMLSNSSNNSNSQSPVSLQIKDAANQGDIFSLSAPKKYDPVWNVNNTDLQVTLPRFAFIAKDDGNSFLWCHYVIARSGNLTFLTITNNATDEIILERTLIEGSSETGGLGNIVFTTKRYSANFAIDNIVVRELQEGDVPSTEMSSYTIKYRNESGEEIKSDIVKAYVVGGEATATAEQMTPIYYNDKKYLYKEGNTTITLVADAAQNVITLVYREAKQCRLTVRAVYGTKDKLLLDSVGLEQDVITYNYPKYMLDGTTLYLKKQSATNPYFGKTITLSEENITETVEYTDGAASDVVFYKEAEQMEGFTSLATNNADIRCSDGKGGVIDGDAPVVLTTLPAGKYVIYGQVWGTTGYTATITADDKTVWELSTVGYLFEGTSEEITLTKETTLYIKDSGDANGLKMLDLIYIQEAKDHYIAEFNRDESTLTFKKGIIPLGSSVVWDAENTGEEPGWYSQLSKVSTVVFEPSFADARPTSCDAWFMGATELTTITGLEYLNTSEVTSMAYMFRSCTSLTSLDLSTFNTEKVTDMSFMFYYTSNLASLNMSTFNTSKVTDMSYMFSECYALTEFNLSNFDTRAVKNMSMMFRYNRMTELDLSSFNTDAVQNIQAMFYNCANLTTIYVNESWTLPSLVINDNMFLGCQSLVGGNGTAYDAEHTAAEYARIDGGTDAPGYFTDKNTPQAYAALSDDGKTVTFYYDTQKFDRTGVVEINQIFRETNNYGTATTAVIDASFADYRPTSTAFWFYQCKQLTSISGIEKLNTSEVTDMSWMFNECIALQSLDVSHFDTKNATSMYCMFRNCSSLTSLDVSHFDTRKVTDMGWMFCADSLLTALDVSHFNTENVRRMTSMFWWCKSLTTLDVSHFDTRKVTDMGWMFNGCEMLENLDVSNFNTANVTDMENMFWGCRKLKTLDTGGFDTKNVTNMGWMFCACNSLKNVNVSKFNTENVTDMQGMFAECYSLESLDVSGFVTDKVTNMYGMFGWTILRSLDLSSFNTSNVENMADMFCWDDWLETIYVSDKWNTNSVENGAGMFHECIKLKGGNGTVYDADHTGVEYARIDGGADAPGYFTKDTTTDIKVLPVSKAAADVIYTLSGQRFAQPRKGINIIGGRKVIVK